MKTSSPHFLSFLLLTLSANFFISSAQSVPAAVLDTDGQELRRGVSYYILPAESGNGGGVSVANDRGVRCPYRITLSPMEGSNGIPVGFSSINTNESIIRLSTDLNIKFTSSSPLSSCPESPVWMLNGTQSSSSRLYVTVDGVEGNPHPETVSSWFKIEKDGDAYQIRFCPSSSFCRPGVLCNFLCGNIGTVVSAALRRLAYVNQETFKVKFTKATE